MIHDPVSYTHLRAHETRHDLVCRLLLEKKKKKHTKKKKKTMNVERHKREKRQRNKMNDRNAVVP